MNNSVSFYRIKLKIIVLESSCNSPQLLKKAFFKIFNSLVCTGQKMAVQVFLRSGGADSAPPIKINVPIHVYMCDACYNPIFQWRVR